MLQDFRDAGARKLFRLFDFATMQADLILHFLGHIVKYGRYFVVIMVMPFLLQRTA